MKKASVWLVAITLLFTAFLGGLFTGRNLAHGPVQVSSAKVDVPASIPPTVPSAADIQEQIDINRASLEELARLPGIGETLAQRIINYREEYGAFQRLSDLMQVEGIGEKKLDAILPHITLGGQG